MPPVRIRTSYPDSERLRECLSCYLVLKQSRP